MPTGNLQCRDEAGAYPWYVIGEIPKIGLFDRTMSARTRYNYREANTHTHIHLLCMCVCVSLQKLCSSVISKRNYEFASRTSVSYFVIFVAEPFVNNFWGRLVDCQVVSDTWQLTANIPINQTSIASILHVREHLDELWIVQLFRAYFPCSK